LCDPQSSPCCTAQCTFAPSTQICHPSTDAICDKAEFCTGNSSSCPADVTAKNGQSCGSNGLACASGQCTSVDLQCQTVGASMGLQAACPNHNDQSCQILCQDPTNSQECIQLTSLLIDGSPCGFGGTCLSGKCQAAGFLDTAKAWYLANLQIAIPVTVIAGLVVLLLLWGIVRAVRRCSGRRQLPRSQGMLVSAIPPMLKPVGHKRLSSSDRPDNMKDGKRTLPGSTVLPAVYVDLRSGVNVVNPDVGYNYSGNNHMGIRVGKDWVDDTLYNGSRQ